MSLLDQFDNIDLDYGHVDEPEEPLFESSYVNVSLNSQVDEAPMFALSNVYTPNNAVSMDCGNDLFIIGLSNGHIIRYDSTVEGSTPEDLEVVGGRQAADPDKTISQVFVSPDGCHGLITTRSGDNYYITKGWDKARKLSKIKDFEVTAVGWNPMESTAETTGEILLGTRTGLIFEANLRPAKSQKVTELIKQVYKLSDSKPVTGLEVNYFPNAPQKLFVMATTPVRIFQFVGGPNYEALFSNYKTNPGFFELPGEIGYSQLCVFTKYFPEAPTTFAWLTHPGVYYGNLAYGNQRPGDQVFDASHLLPYSDDLESTEVPVALLTTEYHFLILYVDRLEAICRLNEEKVFEEEIPLDVGLVRGMCRDSARGAMYVYAERGILVIQSFDEDRDIWKIHLEKGDYERALRFCNDQRQRDIVLTAHADSYFDQKLYSLAATYYAKTTKSFEEVALRFINSGEQDALSSYLRSKLDHIADGDATQKTILCTWLTEIFLNKMNTMAQEGREADAQGVSEEFRVFLRQNTRYLNDATTYDLISSHGRVRELLFFAELRGDFNRVIQHNIQNGMFEEALETLREHPEPALFYKYSPVLMQHVPKDTVTLWTLAGIRTELAPRNLVPALMRYDPSAHPADEENQAIRYLSFCIDRLDNREPSLHNYLLDLFAREEDDTRLLQFLNAADTYFDLKFALRLCTKLDKKRACVYIYALLGMYEEAVELALSIDLELACVNADRPRDDEALRKRLWLRIARHVVEQEQDIKLAISFIAQHDVLKIEDILPFFHDFVLIDDFKAEICDSLADYNTHIESLKEEMNYATESANLIRQDIKDLKNKFGYVDAKQKCDLCAYPVMSREFYLFPCLHIFHCDCYLGEVIPSLTNAGRSAVLELQNAVEMAKEDLRLARDGPSPNAEEINRLTGKYERARQQLDSRAAEECVFCGRFMVAKIDQPFVSAEREARIIRSWEV